MYIAVYTHVQCTYPLFTHQDTYSSPTCYERLCCESHTQLHMYTTRTLGLVCQTLVHHACRSLPHVCAVPLNEVAHISCTLYMRVYTHATVLCILFFGVCEYTFPPPLPASHLQRFLQGAIVSEQAQRAAVPEVQKLHQTTSSSSPSGSFSPS